MLTGSSARKLKSSDTNLLAGRAWLANLYPFNFDEIVRNENKFDLDKIIQFGSLPQVWTSLDPREELDAYLQTYINLELKAEGIIRKIPAFSRFLKSAALNSGELLNYENMASDSQIPASTVREHYIVLEDTLIGFNLDPWIESQKRKAIKSSKFYFFDIGVLNFLSGVFPSSHDSKEFGNRFEHFIINEFKCLNAYQRRKHSLHFWRSTSGFEVDLIFGDYAIEIKSTTKVSKKHIKGLQAIAEEKQFKKLILISRDPIEQKMDGVDCMFYQKALEAFWEGSL